MMWAEGSRGPRAGAMECDIVDSIMRTDRDWRGGVVTWRAVVGTRATGSGGGGGAWASYVLV